jgi:hypothetical protein
VNKLQAKNMRARKLAHFSANLGGYDWIFPIGQKKVGKTLNGTNSETLRGVRDTHYISPDSNIDKSDAVSEAFNFKLAGQTSLGQTKTMANLNVNNDTALLGN